MVQEKKESLEIPAVQAAVFLIAATLYSTNAGICSGQSCAICLLRI